MSGCICLEILNNIYSQPPENVFQLNRAASEPRDMSSFSTSAEREMGCFYRFESEVAQSCPILCNPVDCSPPGSSVHGILQARTLQWLPDPSPGDLPDPGIEPRSPALQADASAL